MSVRYSHACRSPTAPRDPARSKPLSRRITTWGEEAGMVFDVALREGFVLLDVTAPDPRCVRLAPSAAIDLAMQLLDAAMNADETGDAVSSSDFHHLPSVDLEDGTVR